MGRFLHVVRKPTRHPFEARETVADRQAAENEKRKSTKKQVKKEVQTTSSGAEVAKLLPGDDPNSPSETLLTVEELRDIFVEIDRDNNDAVSRFELIAALRKNPKIAATLHLPEKVRQEDGSRDAFEIFFQSLDKDGSKDISWEEFKALAQKRNLTLPERAVESVGTWVDAIVDTFVAWAAHCGCGCDVAEYEESKSEVRLQITG
ncbi:hypothetical protein CYMTET_44078 [Cymbomonas tetramitiformis]|uniref:EF-hand domain-containing protein n=1 Tax=Cymbomonas tetramitiformis TaxID=36881 RepID=A0AAE0EZN8_9CHLO|nr:hypothetical protein CYMTET_44078 [Cymbomonas tetramitiformis]